MTAIVALALRHGGTIRRVGSTLSSTAAGCRSAKPGAPWACRTTASATPPRPAQSSTAWDGARQPVVWTVPPPGMDPAYARLELARRYLHIFGPATAASFAKWAGIRGAKVQPFENIGLQR